MICLFVYREVDFSGFTNLRAFAALVAHAVNAMDAMDEIMSEIMSEIMFS